MKKNIIYLLLFAGVVLSSCKEDEPMYKEGTSVEASLSMVTMFDDPTTVEFEVSNVNLTSINLNGMEIVSEDLPVSGGMATYSFSPADLGDYWAIDSVGSFELTSSFGGYNAINHYTLEVVEALSLSAPASLPFGTRSDTAVISSGAETMGATIDVVIERSINGAAFVALATGNGAAIEMDDLYEWGADYAIGDTIEYRFTGTAGSHVEVQAATIAVLDKGFGDVESGMLSTSEDEFELMEGISLDFVSTETTRGLSSSSVEFVSISEMYYSFNDLMEEINGSTLVSSIDVVKGDMIGYKFTKGAVDYYGTITIGNVTAVNVGDTENGIGFVYKYNMFEK